MVWPLSDASVLYFPGPYGPVPPPAWSEIVRELQEAVVPSHGTYALSLEELSWRGSGGIKHERRSGKSECVLHGQEVALEYQQSSNVQKAQEGRLIVRRHIYLYTRQLYRHS